MWTTLVCLITAMAFCTTGAFQFQRAGLFGKLLSRGNSIPPSSCRRTDLSLARRREVPPDKRRDPIYNRWNNMEEKMDRFGVRHDLPAMFVDLEGDDENELEIFTEEELANYQFEVKPCEIGDSITGTVVDIDDNGAYVEAVGTSAFIPNKEGALQPVSNMAEVVEIGQNVTAVMIGTLKGVPVLSLRNARLIEAWDLVNATRTAGEAFDVEVLEVNRGGAVCTAPGGLLSFLPGSQATSMLAAEHVGTTVKVKILDAIEEEGKIIVSQRLAVTAAAAVPYMRGALVRGTVTGVRPYGVFVEVEGGQSGLLHISQVSGVRPTSEQLEGMFALGEPLSAVMIEFDRGQGRMALSTKDLELEPGDMINNKTATQENAQANLNRYHQRVVEERAAREEAAKEFVASITAALAESTKMGTAPFQRGAGVGGGVGEVSTSGDPSAAVKASEMSAAAIADAVADAVAAAMAAAAETFGTTGEDAPAETTGSGGVDAQQVSVSLEIEETKAAMDVEDGSPDAVVEDAAQADADITQADVDVVATTTKPSTRKPRAPRASAKKEPKVKKQLDGGAKTEEEGDTKGTEEGTEKGTEDAEKSEMKAKDSVKKVRAPRKPRTSSRSAPASIDPDASALSEQAAPDSIDDDGEDEEEGDEAAAAAVAVLRVKKATRAVSTKSNKLNKIRAKGGADLETDVEVGDIEDL